MKIKQGFVVREIAGQTLVVALGEASEVYNGIIKLNETGRVIWDMLAEGAEKEAIVDKLASIYDADRETLAVDCDRFIASLEENGILE